MEFDSVELSTVLRALVEGGIDENYVETIKEANTGCSTEITPFANPIRIAIKKQGDPLLLKVLTTCLEMVVSKIEREGGVCVNGSIIYASRMMGFSSRTAISFWNNQLAAGAQCTKEEVGLIINACKTKIMQCFGNPMKICMWMVSTWEKSTVRLSGRKVNKRSSFQPENACRRVAGWPQFYSIIDFRGSSISPCWRQWHMEAKHGYRRRQKKTSWQWWRERWKERCYLFVTTLTKKLPVKWLTWRIS